MIWYLFFLALIATGQGFFLIFFFGHMQQLGNVWGQRLNLDKEVGPVVYLSMMYRHGDRTPRLSITQKFPKHSDLKKENFPEGWGQLTLLGKRQQYHLGQWLRQRYIHLLPDGRYQPETICAKSTYTDRTLNSAQTTLAGMFPPDFKQSFVEGLNWQPIPVRYNDKLKDKLINMDIYCKKYVEAIEEFKKSDIAVEIQKKFQSLFDIVGVKNENVYSIRDLQELYNVLLIEEARNLTIDKMYADVYPDKLKEASDFSFSLYTYTDTMKRLNSGPILKEIIDNMEKASQGLLVDSCVNITSYSSHDNATANLMNTIGVFNNIHPPYSSVFLVELRKKDDKYFVTTLFKNTTDNSDAHFFPIPGCDKPCSLDTFKTLMRKFIPDNWVEECNM